MTWQEGRPEGAVLISGLGIRQTAAWSRIRFNLLDVTLARRTLGQKKTPLHDRIYDVARPWLALPVPNDMSYERAFDEFEYLFGLVALDSLGGMRLARYGSVISRP